MHLLDCGVGVYLVDCVVVTDYAEILYILG